MLVVVLALEPASFVEAAVVAAAALAAGSAVPAERPYPAARAADGLEEARLGGFLPLGVSVGRRRTRPCDLRRPPAILAPAGVRGRLILPIVDHGRWSGVGLLHYVGRRSGVRLPLCIWRLRVRRAGPPGGGIHLAHTLLWSGANRRLNALDLAHVDDVNRRTPGRRILAHLDRKSTRLNSSHR